MRGTFRVLKVTFREGVSAASQKPYAILSAKCVEEPQDEGQGGFEDIVNITFTEADNVYAKTLEGEVVVVDCTSVKAGFRNVGFEFRGSIVRQALVASSVAA